MIYIRKEGQLIKNGFNFYPLSDERSFGFIFRYGPKIPLTTLGYKSLWFRYSKSNKKWIIYTDDIIKFHSNVFNEGLQAYCDESDGQ